MRQGGSPETSTPLGLNSTPRGAKGGSAGGTARRVVVEPADHAQSRSQGGLTTRLHLGCEQGQKPLSIVLTAGQRGDSPQFITVLWDIRCRSGPQPAADQHGPQLPTPTAAPRARRAVGLRPSTPRSSSNARRGGRHQPAQTQSRCGHPLRQALCALRGHRPPRSGQRWR